MPFDHSFPSVVRYCVVLCKDCNVILLCSVFWSQLSLGSDVALFCHRCCIRVFALPLLIVTRDTDRYGGECR